MASNLLSALLSQIGQGATGVANTLSSLMQPQQPQANMWRKPSNETIRIDENGNKIRDFGKIDFGNLSGQAPAPMVSATPMPTPTPMPSPVLSQPAPQIPQMPATPAPTPSTWRSKFQPIYEKVAKEKGIEPDEFRYLIQTENGQEKPDHINKNSDGTIDVGLLQINVDPKNTAEVERLKDPEYNIAKGLEILRLRKMYLEDPEMALASYNLGAGGAALNPQGAYERVSSLRKKVGLPPKETEFTKNPLEFSRARMEKYKKLGLIKR